LHDGQNLKKNNRSGVSQSHLYTKTAKHKKCKKNTNGTHKTELKYS